MTHGSPGGAMLHLHGPAHGQENFAIPAVALLPAGWIQSLAEGLPELRAVMLAVSRRGRAVETLHWQMMKNSSGAVVLTTLRQPAQKTLLSPGPLLLALQIENLPTLSLTGHAQAPQQTE